LAVTLRHRFHELPPTVKIHALTSSAYGGRVSSFRFRPWLDS
jgi:hypothetical protein